jgi:L-aminopeptidase/D-esterase-like protein
MRTTDLRPFRFLAAFALTTAASGAFCANAPAVGAPEEGPGLSFDLPGVRVGVAEYEEGPTGATLLYFPHRVLAAVDVRGGAPGSVNSEAVRLPHDEPLISAIALAGGSAYGLSVATGVANALKETTADAGNWRNIAVVAGAIIFDLGDRRYNTVTPDEALGRRALKSLREGWIPLGARGAGRFAMQGVYFGDRQHSGQGAAMRQLGAVKVLVVTVVNALGSIVDRNGRVLRCAHPVNGDCGPIAARLAEHLSALNGAKLSDEAAGPSSGMTANTTITVVVTNQSLPFSALQRLAIQVHNSMARAIQPFGTRADGDTLFAVTTADVRDGALDPTDLGTLAAETAWDAILASVPALPVPPPRSDIVVPEKALQAMAGRYEFAPGVIGELRRHGASLEIEASGRDSAYLIAGKPVSLNPVAPDEFEMGNGRADRLQINRDARDRVVGITINPGPWPIRGVRVQGN